MTRCKTNAPKTVRSKRVCVLPVLPSPAPSSPLASSAAADHTDVVVVVPPVTTITTTYKTTRVGTGKCSVVEKITFFPSQKNPEDYTDADIESVEAVFIDAASEQIFLDSPLIQALMCSSWRKNFERNWVV